MDRTIRITPKDSEELAFLCELFDRLGLEYSVNHEVTAGSNLVREPAERYLTTETPENAPLTASDAMAMMQRTPTLTEEQRAAVHQAIASIDAGQCIPHNEVMRKARERFPQLYV
jgi:predicted transcriptional regulator